MDRPTRDPLSVLWYSQLSGRNYYFTDKNELAQEDSTFFAVNDVLGDESTYIFGRWCKTRFKNTNWINAKNAAVSGGYATHAVDVATNEDDKDAKPLLFMLLLI